VNLHDYLYNALVKDGVNPSTADEVVSYYQRLIVYEKEFNSLMIKEE